MKQYSTTTTQTLSCLDICQLTAHQRHWWFKINSYKVILRDSNQILICLYPNPNYIKQHLLNTLLRGKENVRLIESVHWTRPIPTFRKHVPQNTHCFSSIYGCVAEDININITHALGNEIESVFFFLEAAVAAATQNTRLWRWTKKISLKKALFIRSSCYVKTQWTDFFLLVMVLAHINFNLIYSSSSSIAGDLT